MKMYGAGDPLSEAYQLRNPLLLRAFNPKHFRDDKGRRIFKTFIAGYENGLLDLKIKCSGQSRAKLTVDSPLVDLLHVYGQPTTALKSLVRFIRHALQDENIPENVKLGWFLEIGEPEVKEIANEHHAARPA
jgi:hypothetical protein